MSDNKSILVVGGAGYIGSFTVWRLCEEGSYNVSVLDDLSAGHRAAIHSAARFLEGSLSDETLLNKVLSTNKFDAVIHFAALTSVGDSVRDPLHYFRSNVVFSLNLLEAMARNEVKALVFSSTAATYGRPVGVLNENHPQLPVNPYGDTKLTVERMLSAAARAGKIRSVALRYFNACGAAADGSRGEDHVPETHLIPLAIQAALGSGEKLVVFGDDYDTPDGTCVRDYVHVEDLADAHLYALESIVDRDNCSFDYYNIGTGQGESVRAVIDGVSQAAQRPVPFSIAARREGDPPVLVADSSKIQRELGWRPKYTGLNQIIETAVKWHTNKPGGYSSLT